MNSNKRKVLLLDDDPKTLEVLVDYLRSPHLDLVACTEIEAAECLMDRTPFDVLISDLEVSRLGGLEGIRLIRHVTCNFPGTQVIVFSGHIDPAVQAIGKTLGVDALLDKPSGMKRLRELVDPGHPVRRRKLSRRLGSVTRVETLRALLESRSITAVLQPIMALGPDPFSATSFGVEGLSRGPEGSVLTDPEVFLDYASRKERLLEIEMQCIEAVLVEATQLSAVGKLFINTRPRSVSSPAFASALRDLVRLHGFHETDIVLELTEQQSILNLPGFNAALTKLRQSGFGLALDDYGSGFANLHLVQELHLDYLKIDGRFAQGIEADQKNRSIVRATVGMAREIGVSTIMERVETEQELEAVRELGVDFAQGYHFSRPLPGRELAASFHPVKHIREASLNRAALDPNSAVARHNSAAEPFESQAEHELSNLLTAIAMVAAQGMKRVEPDNPLRSDLELIRSAGESAVTLAQEIRASGRGQDLPARS